MRLRSCFAIVAIAAVSVFAAASPARSGEAAFVGMKIQGMSPAIARAMGLDEARGVLVRDVALGGPSDRAGFRRGDLIVRFAGKDIDSVASLVAVVGGLQGGDAVPVTVMRRGASSELTLRAGTWPEAWRIAKDTFVAIPTVGLTLASLTPEGPATVRPALGLDQRRRHPGRQEPRPRPWTSAAASSSSRSIREDVWKPRQVAAAYERARNGERKSLLLLVEGVGGFRFSLLPVR